MNQEDFDRLLTASKRVIKHNAEVAIGKLSAAYTTYLEPNSWKNFATPQMMDYINADSKSLTDRLETGQHLVSAFMKLPEKQILQSVSSILCQENTSTLSQLQLGSSGLTNVVHFVDLTTDLRLGSVEIYLDETKTIGHFKNAVSSFSDRLFPDISSCDWYASTKEGNKFLTNNLIITDTLTFFSLDGSINIYVDLK